MLNFTEPICYNRENAPSVHRREMERTHKADSGENRNGQEVTVT